MKLPTDGLYCPKLSCDVYDYVFRGFNQPLLGTFAIPIGKILEETVQKQKDEIVQSEYIIKELKRALAGEGPGDERLNEEIKLELEGFSQPKINASPSKGTLKNESLRQSVYSASPNDKSVIVDKSAEIKDDLKRKGKSPTKKGVFSKANGDVTAQMESAIKTTLIAEKHEAEQNAKRELEEQRSRDISAMQQSGEKQLHKNIVLPKYAEDERLHIFREVNPPPASIFIGLGYNQKHDD